MKITPLQFPDVGSLYEFTLKDPLNQTAFVDLGILGDLEVTKLKVATNQDFADYQKMIDSYAIRHILKGHGNPVTEARRGQVAVTRSDFLLVDDILKDPDAIHSLGKNKIGREVIAFEKMLDQFYTLVVEVRTKRKKLALDSLWIKKIKRAT